MMFPYTYTLPGPSYGVLAMPEVPAFLAVKLNRFEMFPDGWAAGEGRRFSRETIESARELLAFGDALGRFQAADVFPGRHGQIIATFYGREILHDFAVTNRAVRLTTEVEEQEIGEPRYLTLAEAIQALTTLGTDAWHSSGFYSLKNTNRVWDASKAAPLSHTTIGLVFQSSMNPALSQQAGASVFTPAGSIAPRYPLTQTRFISGASNAGLFRTDTGWIRPAPRVAMNATERLAG
jgi:hypothetical protein